MYLHSAFAILTLSSPNKKCFSNSSNFSYDNLLIEFKNLFNSNQEFFLNFIDFELRSILHIAVIKSNLFFIKFLIENGFFNIFKIRN